MRVINLNNPAIEVNHKDLKRVGKSPLKSLCPACGEGALATVCDKKTGELAEFDRCLKCGQLVRYKDIEELRS